MDEKTKETKETKDPRENYSIDNLFNNPMVQSAMKAMTPDQLEEYEQIGKYMYSTNFENKAPQPVSLEQETVKGIFYIKEALKAGLHPKDMSPKEIQLMYEFYGAEWYKEYGYEKEEVPEPQCALEKKIPLTRKQIRNLQKKKVKKAIKQSTKTRLNAKKLKLGNKKEQN